MTGKTTPHRLIIDLAEGLAVQRRLTVPNRVEEEVEEDVGESLTFAWTNLSSTTTATLKERSEGAGSRLLWEKDEAATRSGTNRTCRTQHLL